MFAASKTKADLGCPSRPDESTEPHALEGQDSLQEMSLRTLTFFTWWD